MAAPPYSRFDFTQWGTGLDSQGLPRDMNKVFDFYKQVAANPNTPYNKGILQGVQKYAKNNPGSASDPFWVTNALDWYWRDIQRNSQKAPTMFGPLDSILKPAITIGAGLINPALGAVVGGGLGAANGGGVLGGLLGAAGGYTGGATLKGLGSAFSNAGGFSTLLNAPGTFASNIGRGALTSLQNFVPGYGGSLAGLLNKAPVGISSTIGKAASTASGLAPIVNGAAAVPRVTPPTTLQAAGSLLSNSLAPGNLLGNVASNLVSNAATGLISGALSPEQSVAGSPAPMGGNSFGINAEWQSPYPQMAPTQRRGIRNQLVPMGLLQEYS